MTNTPKRVAWVTGGGSGIGQAGAEALAADGWTVIVSGRRKDALEVVANGINAKAGGRAETMPLDVSNVPSLSLDAEVSEALSRDLAALSAGNQGDRLQRLERSLMRLERINLETLGLMQRLVNAAKKTPGGSGG